MVATARDIAQRKAFEAELIQQAFHDLLTQLPNRALLTDRLEQAYVRSGRRQGSVGVLFVDLDNFKLINDSLGHQAGDVLLIEAAKRLQSCVRDEDTVSRLGGDEFVILMELATELKAVQAAERIEQKFTRPFKIEGREFVISVSIGIALGDASQGRSDVLLRNADVAMYRAKSEGRAHHVVFHASMQTDGLVRLNLENDLRQAIRRDEMVVYYQPIVNSGIRRSDRGRGPGSLAASHARASVAGGVYLGGRGNRADRSHWTVGARTGLPAGRRLAGGASRTSGADGERKSVAAPVSAAELGGASQPRAA